MEYTPTRVPVDEPRISTQPEATLSLTADPHGSQRSETAAEVVFDVADVTVTYGGHPAIRHVTMPIYRNEITALIGPSGCGKSTFIRCFNRMNDLIPSAQVHGTITYHGQNL